MNEPLPIFYAEEEKKPEEANIRRKDPNCSLQLTKGAR
jgi:hypothetical protein